MSGKVQMTGAVAGIYLSYLMYGLLQERITRFKHGPNGERFTFVLFLLFVQTLFHAVFAFAALGMKGFPKMHCSPLLFAIPGGSYIGAMYFSNSALAYINYPTQVLAKSCKMFPVMLMGIIINKKRYTLLQYFCVTLVTLGICVFSYFKKAKGGSASANEGFLGIGMMYVLVSLVLDGITGPMQEKAFLNLSPDLRPSASHLQLYTNLWAVVYVGVGLMTTGQLSEALLFLQTYPSVMWDILVFSFCSACGQWCIFYTIRHFSALTCVTVTTTRKFFTILASIVWYNHSVNPAQWIGVLMVFAGLGIDSFVKTSPAKQP